jgi:2-iminobutanoate/2-iminopropanoate deaminase
MSITRLNPDTLHKNPAFTQVAVVTNPAKIIYVGGQNGVDTSGKIVSDAIGAQSVQASKNLIAALAAAGATMQHVVKMSIYLVQGQSIQDAFAATKDIPDMKADPATVTVLMVAGLAVPGALIEIEAIAVLE